MFGEICVLVAKATLRGLNTAIALPSHIFEMSLKARAFTAVRWTAAAAVVRAVLHLAQVAALTRILAPSDYGLLAVVSATLAFASHFTDFGLNSAMLQRRDVSEDQRCSLYWANVLLGFAVAGVITCTAPLLSLAMREERLTGLLALSSLVIVIHAAAASLKTQAEKELDFRPIALIELSTALAAVIASITLAMAEYGAYSIVLGSLLGAVLSTMLCWTYLRRGLPLRVHFRASDIKPFLRFGGTLLANNIVSHLNAAADIFIGNRILGAAQMGLFAVPRNLTLQIQDAINPIVTRVGFPLISHVQRDTSQVANVYLQTVRMASSINGPVYIFVAGFAPEIIALLLGAAWQDAGDALRILALWGALRSTGNPVGSLLLGVGRADLQLRWNLALMGLILPCVWVATSHGVIGLALALLALQAILFIPAWYFLVRPTCGLPLVTYCDAALRSTALSICACAAAVVVTTPFSTPVSRCLLGAIVLAAIYLGLSALWNREWLRAVLGLLHLTALANRIDGVGAKSAAIGRRSSND